jgi:hypothetical protein
MTTENIELEVRQKFNLPRFEMRFLSMTSKEVKTFVKIELLKDKVSKLTEDLTKEINEITNNLPYIESSNFSYNVDRLNQFNNELQKF